MAEEKPAGKQREAGTGEEGQPARDSSSAFAETPPPKVQMPKLNIGLRPETEAQINAIRAAFPSANELKSDSLDKRIDEAHETLAKIKADAAHIAEVTLASNTQLKAIESQFDKHHGRLNQLFNDFAAKAQEQKDQLASECEAELQTILSAFTEQQAIREPVNLWGQKLKEHAQAKRLNLRLFIAGLVGAAVFVCALLYVLAFEAEFVEILLAPIGCDPTVGGSSCAGFSLKGTLLTAGVLTLFTLLLWFVRLQMKLYLAERHLALDARERQAFAQSYLGLVREGDVSEEAKEQRALVYAALFRPASDGTVRDEGGVDPSVAAAISKILMR